MDLGIRSLEFLDEADSLLKSPLLVGVVYSLWGVFMDTYSERFIV